MSEHLGYDRHDPAGRGSGNSRNGTRSKTVLTEIGPVEIEVPRDTESSFDPTIVRKRQRRLTGIDEIVLSLTAQGFTTGRSRPLRRRLRRQGLQGHDLADHRQGHRGDDRVVQPAPGSGLSGDVHRRHPRQGPRRPGHQPALLRGHRRHLRRPARHPRAVGRRRRRGRQVLALGAHRDQEPRHRRRLHRRLRRPQRPPEAITTVWPQAVVQTCVMHLFRNTFRYASRQYWDQIARTSARSTPHRPRPRPRNASTSSPRTGAPSIRRSSRCGTTPGPSSCRSSTTTSRSGASSAAPTPSSPSTPATAAPSGPRALPHRAGRPEVPLPVTRSLDPTGRGKARWAMRWKPALNAFAITFEGRITPTRN